MPKVLNIRGVNDSVARLFSAGAAIRGMTQAEYLAALVDLHLTIRMRHWAYDAKTSKWTVGDAETFVDFLGRYLMDTHLNEYRA